MMWPPPGTPRDGGKIEITDVSNQRYSIHNARATWHGIVKFRARYFLSYSLTEAPVDVIPRAVFGLDIHLAHVQAHKPY